MSRSFFIKSDLYTLFTCMEYTVLQQDYQHKHGEYYKDYSKVCMLFTKYTYFKINFPNI